MKPFCSGSGCDCVIPRLHLCLVPQHAECLQLLPEGAQPPFKAPISFCLGLAAAFIQRKLLVCFWRRVAWRGDTGVSSPVGHGRTQHRASQCSQPRDGDSSGVPRAPVHPLGYTT